MEELALISIAPAGRPASVVSRRSFSTLALSESLLKRAHNERLFRFQAAGVMSHTYLRVRHTAEPRINGNPSREYSPEKAGCASARMLR